MDTLTAMLEACGVKDFATGLDYLTDDVFCDWPYKPIEAMPESMVGRDTLRRFFEEGQAPMSGLNYGIQAIYELLDPDMLIAEYDSHAHHLESGVPYHNKYLGIFRFRDGRICYWREYIDPGAIAKMFEAANGPSGLNHRAGLPSGG
jgi:ketosteroid isomerase-like protein